ncbi:oxidoreductase [Usnea florida]
MPANTAAYLIATAQPLEVKAAPYPTPSENEIVVHNRAIAINPADWAMQMLGQALFPTMTFPAIIGEDVAGEIVEIGSGVTGFKVGDRVLGHTSSAFQIYPVIRAHMTSPIPSSLSYEQAAVIPLGLSTAIIGLFGKDYLALQYPSLDPNPTGQTLLIWGGSTSVGSNAIQCAVAAGYDVITTASPHNFPYVKTLGATLAFDYRSPSVQQDLIAALTGKVCAGALTIADVSPQGRAHAADTCLAVVAASAGGKFVAMAAPVPETLPEGVQARFINARDVEGDVRLGMALYGDFLPRALARGSFVPAPEALVVGDSDSG